MSRRKVELAALVLEGRRPGCSATQFAQRRDGRWFERYRTYVGGEPAWTRWQEYRSINDWIEGQPVEVRAMVPSRDRWEGAQFCHWLVAGSPLAEYVAESQR